MIYYVRSCVTHSLAVVLAHVYSQGVAQLCLFTELYYYNIIMLNFMVFTIY